MNLNQVTVPSSNLEQSISFYEKLGLRLIVSTHAHYARFACPDGNSTFSIHKTETTTKTCGVTVYFEDENLDTTVEELMQQGIQFEQLPIDQPWLWREAHLSDPDGNKIILYHAGINRTNPPWKLKNRSDAFFK